MLDHGHAAELGERRLKVIQLESIWPIILVRGAKHFENLKDLIDLGVSHEEWLSLHHLCKNATGGPKINTKGVGLLAKKNFRASVPECDDFVSVGLDW